MRKVAFAFVVGVVFLAFFIVVALFALNRVPLDRQQKLLLIVVGGLRHDFVDRDPSLIGFPRLGLEGVKAEYLMPVFPSSAYPNWYSIATGLYPEYHGIVQNRMYDPTKKQFFLMYPDDNRTNSFWWDEAQPIWARATKKGINTTVFYLDGCQVPFAGAMNLTQCTPWKDFWSWKNVQREFTRTLYSILDDFVKERLSFAMVYYRGVDAMGHKYGPDANETLDAVRDIDLIIYNLLNQLERRSITSSVNVYVMSDHGMSAPTHRIKLETVIDFDEDVEFMMEKGAFSMIWPKDTEAQERIMSHLRAQQIKGLHYYLKEDIPEGFHVKNHYRTAPILLRADPDYVIDAVSIPEGWATLTRIHFSRIFRAKSFPPKTSKKSGFMVTSERNSRK